MVNTIVCSGSYFEIGETHGKQAAAQIASTISNYATYFKDTHGMDRSTLLAVSERVKATLQTKVPHLYEEMQGIAEGSGADLADIIILNARSEIVLTAGSAQALKTEGLIEGCSTFAQKFGDDVWTAQNWDWQSFQRHNLVHLIVTPPKGPKCHILTEAGLVGKIGINELGVSVNVNAIKATNLNLDNIPIHVLLRVALEYSSLPDAARGIQSVGAASVGHIMIGDPNGFISFETNPAGPWGETHPDAEGRVYHTNHLIAPNIPSSVNEVFFIKDTQPRLERLKNLVHENIKPSGNSAGSVTNGVTNGEAKLAPPSFEGIIKVLEDEEGEPFAILRGGKAADSETIFTIVNHCNEKRSMVAIGRDLGKREMLELVF